MRWMLSLAGCAAIIVALGACGTESSGVSDGGIRVEARQAVLVTGQPLGDVVVGVLKAGDAATAVCFVVKAQTNTGAVGSAVKIKSDRLSGYAAVSAFPPDAADRSMIFDVNERDLRERISSCRS